MPVTAASYAPPAHPREDVLGSELHRRMRAIAFPERTGNRRQFRARRLDRFHRMKLRFGLAQRQFPQRLANYLRYRLQRGRRARVGYLPPEIGLESCLNCVLGCPGCHVGLRNSEGKDYPWGGTISLELAREVIDEVHDKAFQVALYVHGEPLLNKHFFEICAHATRRGLWTTIHTNLNPKVPELSSRLIDCGLKNLVVSIDGATQETYEKYRKKGDLARVLDGIRSLAELKRERRARFPWVTAKFLVFEHNWHEIELYRDTLIEHGADEVVFVEGFANGIYRTGRASTEVEFDIDTLEWQDRDLPTVCPFLWQRASFDWDAGLFPCGAANNDEHKFSRRDDPAAPDALAQFNSPSHVRMRQFFLDGAPWSGEDLPSPCNGCEIVRRNRERSARP